MPRLRKLSFLALSLCVGLCVATQASGQSDEERSGARALARLGATAFKEGKWADAVKHFERAEGFVHAPPHLVYMARAHIELGHLVEARELLLRVKNEGLAPTAPPAFQAAKDQAVELLPTLAPRIPQLTVNVQDLGDREIVIDVSGKTLQSVFLGVPRGVNPGKQTVNAVGDGIRADPVNIELAEGESKAVTLVLKPDPTAKLPGATPPPEVGPKEAEPEPAPATPADASPAEADEGGTPWPMFVAFGVGGVGVILGSVFAASSASSRSDADTLYDERCAPPNDCREGDPDSTEIQGLYDDAGSAQTLAIVSYAVGGVGIAAGATLLILELTGDDGSVEAGGVRLSPVVGVGSAGFRGSF